MLILLSHAALIGIIGALHLYVETYAKLVIDGSMLVILEPARKADIVNGLMSWPDFLACVGIVGLITSSAMIICRALTCERKHVE